MSVAVWSHKHLLNLAFDPLFLIVRYIFVFGQEYLKRTGLVCDSVHTINFEIHPSIERSPSNHIFKFKLTRRIRIFFLTNTLVNFSDLKSLTPYLTHHAIELLL